MATRGLFCFLAFVLLAVATTASSKLSSDFYEKSCPLALPTIKRVVEAAVQKERRMGASLLRLHFHDCFVNGCDGSILLDSTPTIDSEKNARPNLNSARGFEVVDKIKSEVDEVCGHHQVVSCADILALAARDSGCGQLEGPTWEVKLGRRDSTTASKNAANNDIPAPFFDLPALIANFKKHGLDETDLVALSGGHTIGFARCTIFRNRIYNDTNIDHEFAESLRSKCPHSGGDSNLAPLDPTPARFEAAYFTNLIEKKGLLHSDQALFSGDHATKELVKEYSSNAKAFSRAFAKSMVKMGNIKPLTGDHGEIRTNCRKVN